ncbi:hypothetical protein [Streptomyces fulvorobeus]|uniref:Uncharacterized protein n=1 Tax=Streptomyces fulvorobeus TaxID=284028 RepID=A0A7Y9HIP3_9ACTN|nr:hypothetical protein [Streptomyces fulvorobeus]NYE44784.1 hypothetical protein [Streptomyces fulvorobeus]
MSQQDGGELLTLPYQERRARSEALFTEYGLTAWWTVSEQRYDSLLPMLPSGDTFSPAR